MDIFTMEEVKPNSIFLAGGNIRNGKYIDSWRYNVVRELKNRGFNGNILIPEWKNDKKPEGWTLEKQIEWERLAMNTASIIVFWIPREMKTLPCLTTNIEFGEWFKKKNIIVGSPINAEKNEYLQSRFYNEVNSKWFSNEHELVGEIIIKWNNFNNKRNNFLTSDTHFNNERTLKFSNRPFININDMNLALISNWNNIVSNNDTVYHLGDFGDSSFLKYLNFKELYLIEGNYERDNKEQNSVKNYMDDRVEYCAVKHRNIQVLFSNTSKPKNKNLWFELVHEPLNITYKKDFFYGHIHQLGNVKRIKGVNRKTLYGVSVCTDSWNYTPVELSVAMEKIETCRNFYDENVYM